MTLLFTVKYTKPFVFVSILITEHNMIETWR